jgi:hypothetical protein
MSKHCRFTPVLTKIVCALLMMAGFAVGPSAASGQTPPPATFVNPTLFNGGNILNNYSPIPVQEMAVGDFNHDGFPDIVVLDSNADVNGWGIMFGRGDGTFTAEGSLGTSGFYGNVGSIVTGDFNHDGNLDFAVTYSTNAAVGMLSVYLGNGAGGFTVKGPYSMLGSAYNPVSTGLATADLRGNGNLDLITIDPHNGNGTGAVDVFLGNGDGTFQNAVAVTVNSPQGLALADLNHDGKPDMVVASNANLDGIYVLLGKGDGTFQTPVFYSQGSNSGAFTVAVGQLIAKDNGDVVLGAGNGAYVYLNNGDGTFKTPVLFAGPAWAESIVIADVNGDTKMDLVATSYTSSTVWVLLGTGKGTFTAGTSYSTDGLPQTVVVADFNGDKKLDFATSNSNGEWITVALGNGDGTFRASQGYGYTWNAAINGIATADLNGDGYPDIVQAGGGTGVGIAVQLGSSHGALGSPISTAVGVCGEANRNAVNSIAVGDVTGDGKVDVVATSTNNGFNFCVNNEVAVLAGLGTGKFKAPVFYSTGVTVQSYNVQLADFNGDGKLDIVVSNGDGSLSVLLNKGKGVYGAATVISAASGSGGGSIVVGDFNKDGKLDIAVTDYNQKQINVLLGNGDGTFKSPIGTPSPIIPFALAGGDFNKDGKLDLALTGWGTGDSLTIFTGNGDGTFSVGTTYAFNTWEQCYPSGDAILYWISAGDLNQDGKLDLAIGVQNNACNTEYSGENSWGDALVYTGNGDGTFQLDDGPWLGGGLGTSGIALADFNGDGMIDIAVAGNANWTTQQWVSILQNNTQPASISPLAMTYKAQVVGTSSPAETVIVTNDEKATLDITKVALAGTDPGDFSLKSACGSSLLTGANCTLTVTFKPTAVGKRTATLSITDGDGTQAVSLTGTGEETISGFTPPSGPVGTSVTITGTALTGTTKVTFGGVAASTFKVNSDTQVTATVPTGAKTGKIGVTTNGVTVTSKTNFTVT